jgi:hypothetical protein
LIAHQSQLVLITNTKLTVYQLPKLNAVFAIPIQGEATCVYGFNALPGVLFLGLRLPNNLFAISVITSNG